MDREELIRTCNSYAAVMPWRAPDFAKIDVAWFWYNEFKNYTIEDVKKAFRDHLKRNDHFPSVREMNSLLSGNTTDDQTLSHLTAIAIIHAIRKFGWPNEKEALAYIGDLGKSVVDRFGGWVFVCESVTEENLSFFSHNLKQICLGILKDPRKDQLQIENKGQNASDQVKFLVSAIEKGIGDGCKKGNRNPKRNLAVAVSEKIQSLEKLLGTEDDLGEILREKPE